jgi:hypothetical protein
MKLLTDVRKIDLSNNLCIIARLIIVKYECNCNYVRELLVL